MSPMNRRRRGRGPAAHRVPPRVVTIISNPEQNWEERIRFIYETLLKSAMKSRAKEALYGDESVGQRPTELLNH